jgi:uncharacterized protein YqgC (DUF456 family)
MSLVLFAAVLLGCLALIPLGLPGLWVMLAAALGYNALPGPAAIGTATLVGALLLAVVAEVLEFTVAARYTTRYGGSRRAGWGAILGGVAGAVVGVPVPVVGSVIGAFVGAFAGAYLAERSRRAEHGAATRVATGALVGRAAAAALKTACGLAIAAWLVTAAAIG